MANASAPPTAPALVVAVANERRYNICEIKEGKRSKNVLSPVSVVLS